MKYISTIFAIRFLFTNSLPKCYIEPMHLGTKIYTKLYGAFVGEDQFGNKYYRSKKKEDGFHVGKPKTERRWVIYKGMDEPTKVPAEWHGWLHYLTDETPISGKSNKKYSWQKEHTPNLTGTKGAYFPPGDKRAKGSRNKVSGDYEAWQPDK